jgi:hypothetical protein
MIGRRNFWISDTEDALEAGGWFDREDRPPGSPASLIERSCLMLLTMTLSGNQLTGLDMPQRTGDVATCTWLAGALP